MKTILKTTLLLFAIILFNCTTVDSGHRGVEVSWGGETNMEIVYSEGLNNGLHWILDDMIEYDCREQTMTLSGEFLDYDGLDTDVEVILYYSANPSQVNLLHQKVGEEYRDRLHGIFKSAVKTVIAQHQALKLNREERDIAENKLEQILQEKLPLMYLDFKQVEVTDVDLPKKISDMIVKSKEQDERNNLAAKLKIEAQERAAAEEARAEGEFRAAEWDSKTKDILSQPKMLELKRLEIMEEYAKKGVSPWGNNNVFGSSNIGLWKSLDN